MTSTSKDSARRKPTPSPSPRARLFVVAGASALQLAFEVLFIKLGRYEVGNLSIAIVGLAILGVALAGPLTGWLGGSRIAPGRALVALVPAAGLAGALYFSLPHVWTGEFNATWRAAQCGLAALIVLALCSVPVFAELKRSTDRVAWVYGASLAGATVGAPAVLGLLQLLGDAGAYAVVLTACAPGGAVLLGRRSARAIFVAATLAAGGIGALALPALDRSAHPNAVAIETDAVSRICGYPRGEGQIDFRTAGINGHTLTAGGDVATPPRAVMRETSVSPFWLRPRSVLILGSGAGRNVVQALKLGAERVVAVDINRMVPEAMLTHLPATADPYRDPRVELIIGEGRETAARLAADPSARFDLVYVPLATLFGGSGHTLTQTYLMTQEAFESYVRLLAPNGNLAVFSPNAIRPRVVRAMAAALKGAGVRNLPQHLAVIRARRTFVALGRVDQPVTPAERKAIAWHRGLPFDITQDLRHTAEGALTDDNPFLYGRRHVTVGRETVYGWNQRFLRWGLLASLGLLFLVTLLETQRRRGDVRRGARAGYLAAFATLGMAYTAFQVLVLQRLAFTVGHPVLATALVLPASLLGSSLGSFLVGRVPPRLQPRIRWLALAWLLLSFAPLALLSPAALMLPSWPYAIRVALAVLLALLPFIPMGSYFPAAFARAQRLDGSMGTAGWLLNGIGAIFGSVLAIYGPMHFGFGSTLALAAVAYAGLTAWDGATLRRPNASRPGIALALGALALSVALVIALEIASSPA